MVSTRSDRRRLISPATASPRSFYKIILPSIMHDHKLRIPEDFAKNYGSELSASVTLTVRCGQVSRVGVEKTDKILWFTDGWNEFSEKHSIGCGFFVVFNYEGNSKFNVLIFDLTATEIHNPREKPNEGNRHPVSNKRKRRRNVLVKKLGRPPSRPAPDDLENEMLDEYRDQSRTGKRCCRSLIQNLFAFAPEFSLRITERGICMSSVESLRSNFPYLTRNRRYKMEDQGKIVKDENVTISCRGKMKASEMQDSPKSSADKSTKERRNLTKNVENLAAFPSVRILRSHINREDNEGQCKQSDSLFVQEAVHMSKDGQQLKLEPDEADGKDSRNISRRQPVTTQGREKAVNASMMFKPNKPFFRNIMKSYNVRNSTIMFVPAEFAKKYLHRVSGSIELQDSGGKKWAVRCIRVRGSMQSLSGGWRQFAWDNNLEEGDVCVFELIRVRNVVLKVSIFRANEDTRKTNLLI